MKSESLAFPMDLKMVPRKSQHITDSLQKILNRLGAVEIERLGAEKLDNSCELVGPFATGHGAMSRGRSMCNFNQTNPFQPPGWDRHGGRRPRL